MFIFSIALVKLPTGPVKITGPVGMISPQKTMERSTMLLMGKYPLFRLGHFQ